MEISVDIKKDYPKEPKILIQCQEETEQVKEVLQLLKTTERKLIGSLQHEEHVIDPKDVYYGESVDGVTYLYTKEEVYRTSYSLTELEERYSMRGFFRCSKSTVLNVHAIKSLRSEVGNRIDARLDNEEHIIISRKYAKQLRNILKGGDQN